MTGKERRRNTALTILIFFTLAFIWGNSLMSRDESDGLSRWILQHIFRGVFIVDDIDSGNHILRKCAHFTEFAFLGLLLCVRFRGKRRFWLFGTLAFAAAAADETIQLFSGRGSRAADVLLDCSGAVFGIIVASVLLSLVRKRKRLRNGGLGRRPSVE